MVAGRLAVVSQHVSAQPVLHRGVDPSGLFHFVCPFRRRCGALARVAALCEGSARNTFHPQ